MGGDITWVCLGNGQYKFTMRVYRDCNGVAMTLPVVLSVWNHPSVSSIAMNLISQTDISPQCNGSGPTINCGMGSTINPVPGAVEEFVFESNPVTLAGVPPPQGWGFTYDFCCRNAAITNLSVPQSHGMTLRAIMYAYNGINNTPCTDSSPQFAERPAIVICAGSPFKYNHNAYDPDLDSLRYDWAPPLEWINGTNFDPTTSQPPNLIFAPGYSATSPLPGPALNPNNTGASLNPNTGEVAFTSYTLGLFVTTIRVQSFKCGQLVAEIFREIQIVILSCPANNPPTVTPPFTDPNTGQPSFDTTVLAGDLVNFTLAGMDLEYLPIGVAQSVTITSSGGQYGTGFTNPNSGCANPPCATLQPPPPFTGAPGQGAQTTFNWQTTCNHIAQNPGCVAVSNKYIFVFRVRDDFCPAPSQNIVTVSVTVLAKPVEPSPELRCVSVLPNGDVQLSWLPIPNLVNTFNSYQIYSSTSLSGPYTVVDSIFNINASSYTYSGAGANNQSIYYFIKTRSGCDGIILSPAIDTVQSIYLSVTDPNNGANAQLNWNALHAPALPTTSPRYLIFKEYPLGTWALIDSTQLLSYSDPLVICSDSINYRVEVDDASGCTSSSNIDGRLFQNLTPPSIVVMDTVSVDAAGHAVMAWQPGPSADAVGYIIYQNIGGNFVPIDTVFGYNNTTYTNPLSNASAGVETYAIAAFDSCGGYGNYGLPHNTISVKAGVDPCTGEAVLTWNTYQNMQGGVANYIIYQNQNGGPYTQLATVPTAGYTVPGITPGVPYCYYVQAVDVTGNLTSTSGIACLTADSISGPQFLYLNRATVRPYGEAYVSCLVDTNASVTNYKLYRTDSIGIPFSYLLTLNRLPGAQFVTYIDNAANTNESSYYYQLAAVDKCGNESKISNLGRTILLQGTANEDLTNTLTWNPYEAWDANVSHYNLYRSIDFSPYSYLANITPAPFFMYDDTVRDFIDGNGRFCYYIEAVENNGNSYGLKDTSRSNILCLQQRETVYIPNAFTPEGSNPIFMPVGTFLDTDNYSFLIYNRWGELLFESYKPGEGWDGMYAGQPAADGMYAYILRYKTTTYRDVKKLGTVVLLR